MTEFIGHALKQQHPLITERSIEIYLTVTDTSFCDNFPIVSAHLIHKKMELKL